MACSWISDTGLLNRIDEIARKRGESTGKIGYLSATRQHFDQHDTDPIEITSIVDGPRVDHLLWRCIRRRTKHLTLGRGASNTWLRIKTNAYGEVDKEAALPCIDHDIGRLHVAMHYLMCMSETQGIQNLNCNFDSCGWLKLRLFAQECLHSLPMDVLHDKVRRLSVRCVHGTFCQYVRYVRMLKPGEKLSFTNEALLHSGLVANKCTVEKLHCNAPIQAALFGHIYASA